MDTNGSTTTITNGPAQQLQRLNEENPDEPNLIRYENTIAQLENGEENEKKELITKIQGLCQS